MQIPSETQQFAESLGSDYLSKAAAQVQGFNAPQQNLATTPNPQQLETIAAVGNHLAGLTPLLTVPPPVTLPVSNGGNTKLATVSPVGKVAPISGGVSSASLPAKTTAPISVNYRTTKGITLPPTPNQPTATAPKQSQVVTVTAPKVVATPRSTAVSGLRLPSTPTSPSRALPSPSNPIRSTYSGGPLTGARSVNPEGSELKDIDLS